METKGSLGFHAVNKEATWAECWGRGENPSKSPGLGPNPDHQCPAGGTGGSAPRSAQRNGHRDRTWPLCLPRQTRLGVCTQQAQVLLCGPCAGSGLVLSHSWPLSLGLLRGQRPWWALEPSTMQGWVWGSPKGLGKGPIGWRWRQGRHQVGLLSSLAGV